MVDNNCDGLIDNDVQVGLLLVIWIEMGMALAMKQSMNLVRVQLGRFSGDCDDTSSMVSQCSGVCNLPTTIVMVADNQAVDPRSISGSDGDGWYRSIFLSVLIL